MKLKKSIEERSIKWWLVPEHNRSSTKDSRAIIRNNDTGTSSRIWTHHQGLQKDKHHPSSATEIKTRHLSCWAPILHPTTRASSSHISFTTSSTWKGWGTSWMIKLSYPRTTCGATVIQIRHYLQTTSRQLTTSCRKETAPGTTGPWWWAISNHIRQIRLSPRDWASFKTMIILVAFSQASLIIMETNNADRRQWVNREEAQGTDTAVVSTTKETSNTKTTWFSKVTTWVSGIKMNQINKGCHSHLRLTNST